MSSPQGNPALRFIVVFLAGVSFVDLFVMMGIILGHAYSPAAVQTSVLVPMTFVLAGSAAAAVLLGLLYSLLSYPAYRRTILGLVLIVAALFAAHLYTINLPTTANCHDNTKNVDGCIMDEVYYVPAAQTILAGEKCAPYADNCNVEHPFLSKAFIAAGIAIFGNDTFGWRIFEVILGTLSIPLLFGICWSITRNARLSLYASYLLAFETLFFVHSSIAVIDISAMFFALLGFFLYFAKVRWWRFDSKTLAAVAFGFAALSKETSIILLFALIAIHLLLGEGSRGLRLYVTAEIFLTVALVFIVGLQVYDSLFGAGAATTFLGQIGFILKYGSSLTGSGWTDTLLHTPITPLNWMTYYSPIGYLVTTVTVTSASTHYNYISVGYYGITNQFEVWLTYLWGAYTVYLWRKTRAVPLATEEEVRDFKLARVALVWFLVVYLVYVALFVYGRVTYPYYIIEAVPAIAMGCAYFLTRSWFPPTVAYVLLIGVFAWFFLFYPDKSFLPEQFRAWLGH